ncbi:rCG50961 [Rattus norvegicus]|uniref:RCG50961 n=1 Tax=Rattus norvegicus TaxID=10116 RepID=A6KGG3_RAT|nr:rCG50961 [Rattus norvegicus]
MHGSLSASPESVRLTLREGSCCHCFGPGRISAL